VLGDPVRLRQVVVNLTSNAVKFTSEGEVLINVVREHVGQKQEMLRVEVSDTGIGMSAEAQTKLFQPFQQADTSTTRNFGGTGLGLAICKRLITAMGGEIGCISAPMQGSTFWFHIPLRAGRGMERVSKLYRTVVRMLCLGRGEQFPLDRMAALGVSATATAQAEFLATVARATTKPKSFDILLAVPTTDDPRLGALFAALAQSAWKRVPVIVLARNEADIPALRQAGAAAVLVIPVRTSLLTQTVFRLLGRAPDSTPSAAPVLHGRVLVAEDNGVNQRLITTQLGKVGLTCVIAADGAKAVEEYRRSDYDLILMDCHMPVMDGYRATAEIRALGEGRPRIPIIALTANAQRGDRERCLAAGMDDYLSKPLDQDQLYSVLMRHLPTAKDDAPEGPLSPATPIHALHVRNLPAARIRTPAPAKPGPAQASASATPEWDAEALVQLRERNPDDPGLVEDLVAIFLRETPELLAQMQIPDVDRQAAGRIAHRVKGGAGALGLTRLIRACVDLEAKVPDPRAALPVAEVVAAYASASAHLKRVAPAPG